MAAECVARAAAAAVRSCELSVSNQFDNASTRRETL